MEFARWLDASFDWDHRLGSFSFLLLVEFSINMLGARVPGQSTTVT